MVPRPCPLFPKAPGSRLKPSFICSAFFIQFFCGGWGIASLSMWLSFLSLLPQAHCPLLGEGLGAQRPDLEEKQGTWSLHGGVGLLLWRKRVGRYTACQHSELHYFPSWGCRVVGGRSVPQPQQSEGLRDQVSRVAPEKQLRARAPRRGNDRTQG